MNNHISFPTASSNLLNDNLFQEELDRMNLNEEDLRKIQKFLNNTNNKKTLLPDFLYRYERQNLPECIRMASLRHAIRKKAEEIPSNRELQDFILSLETSSKLFIDLAEKFIAYNDLADILSKCSKRLQNLVQPALLFHSSRNELDEEGRLNTDIIVQYVNLKATLFQYRIILSYYDEEGTGYLNRQQLTNFFHNEIFKSMKGIKNLEESFLDCYLNTMLSMFFFFLDPKNFGRCRIADILVSGFLESIYALENFNESVEDSEALMENWFSIPKTTELIRTFQSLDEIDKGYLSMDDFSKILNSSFTSAFIKRFFEVYVIQQGTEMTYGEYVYFEVAQNHLAHPSSIAYFFKIIDINDDGFITHYELNYFYRDLANAYNKYVGMENLMPTYGDFSDQLIDMAQPVDSTRITLTDLINCRQGHDFILCLINYLEFYRYENRGEDAGEEEGDTIMDVLMESDVKPTDEGDKENNSEEGQAIDETFVLSNNFNVPLQFDEITMIEEEINEILATTGRTFSETSV